MSVRTTTCAACGTKIFYRGAGRPRRYCLDCGNAAKQRAYYEANREKIAAKQRAYREANREKIAAKQRAYYEANREKTCDECVICGEMLVRRVDDQMCGFCREEHGQVAA